MPVQSKYSDQQVEAVIEDLLAVLTKHGSQTDLSLMALGDCVSYILKSKVSNSSRELVVAQFSKALARAVKAD